jgi:predicted DCC family thiol-disulfide oxidoreductase YuxK
MTDAPTDSVAPIARPLLLFDGKCAVCRRIGHWVETSALGPSGIPTILARAVGDSPEALHALNPNLDIWDAYATVHVLMPDGTMKLGGEAVAEVLRRLPSTAWFAGIFDAQVFGARPFQGTLNLAYALLDDARPLLGCESCGAPSAWVKAVRWVESVPKVVFGGVPAKGASPHLTARHATRTIPSPTLTTNAMP